MLLLMRASSHGFWLLAAAGIFAALRGSAWAGESEVKQVPDAAFEAARADAKNFNDVRTHIMPTPSARKRLPVSVLHRNNFQNFDLRKESGTKP
jgi:hypothetical protein